MNVLVFGWYHHQNAGDDRIQHCLTQWLDGDTLGFLPAGRPPPPTRYLRQHDAVLIGGGGILQRRGGVFRDLATWVRKAGCPVGLIAVSAEALPDDLAAEVRAFLDVGAFAWFRDRASLDAVGDHPSAFVAPDLTWLDPYPVWPAGEGIAVAVTAKAAEPVDDWRAALAGIEGPVHPWPLYFEAGGDTRNLTRMVDGDVPDRFTLDPLRRARVVVASRYHALVFALQAGRAVIGVGGEPKVRRLLEQHDLGDWWLPDTELAALPERLAAIDSQVAPRRSDLVAATADAAARAKALLAPTA